MNRGGAVLLDPLTKIVKLRVQTSFMADYEVSQVLDLHDAGSFVFQST
jgi:hypothetical protein